MTVNSLQIDPRTLLNCLFAHDKKNIHPLLEAKCGFTRMYPSDNEISLDLDLGIKFKKLPFLTFIINFI